MGWAGSRRAPAGPAEQRPVPWAATCRCAWSCDGGGGAGPRGHLTRGGGGSRRLRVVLCDGPCVGRASRLGMPPPSCDDDRRGACGGDVRRRRSRRVRPRRALTWRSCRTPSPRPRPLPAAPGSERDDFVDKARGGFIGPRSRCLSSFGQSGRLFHRTEVCQGRPCAFAVVTSALIRLAGGRASLQKPLGRLFRRHRTGDVVALSGAPVDVQARATRQRRTAECGR